MDEVKHLGIIGQGFVGSAIREKFKNSFKVFTYDKMDDTQCNTYNGEIVNSDTNNLEDIIDNCDIIFLCVPTPMIKETGECSIHIVIDMIKEITNIAEDIDKRLNIIIKSTVPPGTTEKMNKYSKLVNVSFSPEFLTEANAVDDFENQNRIVLGIDYIESVEPLVNTFNVEFPNADILVLSSKEAEMVKYMANLFLATKVSYFNDMYKICESLNINYDNVVDTVLYDPRIGKSHYNVPGPDGDLGYGGHCFPKDFAAMLFIAEQLKLNVPTLEGAVDTNNLVRKNKDWEKMVGRAVI